MSDASPPAESSVDAHPPRAYLGWGLATTVLCFVPTGLVALLYGFRTNRALMDGRVEDAISLSVVTRRWLYATVALGVLLDIVLAAVIVMMGAFSP